MGEERKEREVCGQKNYVWNHILDWYAGGEIEERREENQNIGRSRWNYKRWKIIKGWKKGEKDRKKEIRRRYIARVNSDNDYVFSRSDFVKYSCR